MKRTDRPPQRYPLALPGLGGSDSGPVPLAPSTSACPDPVLATEAGRVLRVFLAQLPTPNQFGKAPHSLSPGPLQSLLSVGMEEPPGYPMSLPFHASTLMSLSGKFFYSVHLARSYRSNTSCYFTFLCLSFLICQLGIIITISTS